MNISAEKKWIDEVFEKVDKKLSKVAVRSYNKLPSRAVNGIHDDHSGNNGRGVGWWTNGFLGGMMWLMYSETGKKLYKDTAVNSEKLLNEALKDFKCLHHDVGFMWHLTTGANYRLTGNTESYNTNLFVASTLASRYNVDGGFITAWNGEGHEGWSIVDCLMNIPMLYWASKETNHDHFKRVAMHHADMTIRDHIREDGTVNHIVVHDQDTGDVIEVRGGQGYSADSCWTRGLSWAVYGMALSYIHTKKSEYLDAAIRCADCFIERCKEYNYITPADFDQPEDVEYYDSSAGLITACGLLELAKYVDKEKAEYYIDAAIKMVKATDERFCDYSEDTDTLVLDTTGEYPHNDDSEVNIYFIWSDFFYVEALLKLRGNDFLIW